ncbi:DUF58 domain-containing protein [Blastopirellula marina]|uniref:DUF58 domain-containing protein n=1 Tax=Blastopirellula marina TaxID=124 RepID=A0A2S8G4M3_9BACT|nr:MULTISPECIES: DUF58 domain-containing protein [Pirellulaceae]PQO39395.1 DUF58 domain-containing protein [Blastopirellula marina]RCS55703.1 DUF58 domain-containing protein [Bremerella cremea]
MIPREVLQKIRRIQIRTSHLADNMLAGQYHSAFKGRGVEFEEVRPYRIGDDVRAIDWNVTARTGEPFVKLFREERQLTATFLVDLSASQSLGTHWQSKRELVAEIGATLAFSAISNNDKVALTLFTDDIEKAIPPRSGSRHVLRVIRELLYCEPIGHGTNLSRALEHLNRTAKRRSIAFVISDFQDANYEQALKVARRKHDIIPIVVSDRREYELPNVGLLDLVDSETGQVVVVDTSSRHQRQRYAQRAEALANQRDQLFKRLRMDPIHVRTGEDFVDPLRKFFSQRECRR